VRSKDLKAGKALCRRKRVDEWQMWFPKLSWILLTENAIK
jgi:hypothetical protein